MRGELLTNGFKSLRAQGMLRALKVENGGTAEISIAKSLGKRKSSAHDLEQTNICIKPSKPEMQSSSPPQAYD